MAETYALSQPPMRSPADATKIDLIEAQHAFAIIDVQPQSSTHFFQSAILAVDPPSRTIMIDDLFPACGLQQGAPLAITLRLTNERRVRFSTRVIDKQPHGDAICYRVAMPDHLTYNQRRDSYRFRLSEGFAEFHTHEGYYCAGSIQDISLTGARVLLDHQIVIAPGAVLNRFSFEFSGNRFNCEAIVKRCHRDIENKDIIGVEFNAMPRAQQRILEKAIFQLHRSVAKQHAENRVKHPAVVAN